MNLADTLAVEASGISFGYNGRAALDGFSLAVPRGSIFGLLGPNGSGKSTFITMLAAMETPAVGRLRAFGEAPAAALRRRVGTVFQENAQDPLMSVGESLMLAGRLFGMPRSAAAARATQLLDAFALGERRRDAIATLSGGMRRRLEMARALLHDPELLLLDEPTTGVDADERRALWSTLLGAERGGRTVLLATNDLHEADDVCDRVAFLRSGQVVARGTPEELKRGLRREALRVLWPEATAEQLRVVAEWPGTGSMTQDGETVRITTDDAGQLVPRLFALAPGEIRSVGIERSSLEDAYFQHVGRRLQAGAGTATVVAPAEREGAEAVERAERDAAEAVNQ